MKDDEDDEYNPQTLGNIIITTHSDHSMAWSRREVTRRLSYKTIQSGGSKKHPPRCSLAPK